MCYILYVLNQTRDDQTVKTEEEKNIFFTKHIDRIYHTSIIQQLCSAILFPQTI